MSDDQTTEVADKILAQLDPLPVETHPYRPSIDLSVAVLCLECNCIYAQEATAHGGVASSANPAHDGCPRCANAVGFPINRVIRERP